LLFFVVHLTAKPVGQILTVDGVDDWVTVRVYRCGEGGGSAFAVGCRIQGAVKWVEKMNILSEAKTDFLRSNNH
jgi:hypothetical protein